MQLRDGPQEGQHVTSARKRESNRRNGRKGRGPRTAAGKLRSSCNALRHGFAQYRGRLDASRMQPTPNARRELFEGAFHLPISRQYARGEFKYRQSVIHRMPLEDTGSH
jgi:hypothetical protein